MTKAELVEHVTIIVKLPKRQFGAVLAGDYGRSAQGKHYRVARLWALRLRHRPARTGHNSRTGDILQMPA